MDSIWIGAGVWMADGRSSFTSPFVLSIFGFIAISLFLCQTPSLIWVWGRSWDGWRPGKEVALHRHLFASFPYHLGFSAVILFLCHTPSLIWIWFESNWSWSLIADGRSYFTTPLVRLHILPSSALLWVSPFLCHAPWLMYGFEWNRLLGFYKFLHFLQIFFWSIAEKFLGTGWHTIQGKNTPLPLKMCPCKLFDTCLFATYSPKKFQQTWWSCRNWLLKVGINNFWKMENFHKYCVFGMKKVDFKSWS